MNTTTPAIAEPIVMKRFYAPKNLIKRFVAKRTRLSALVLGVILAVYMIAKASSYVKLYPTEAARQKVAETLGANIGVEAILGVAHHLETVGGYAVWNFLCLLAAAGAIWALLIATKTFRGEEDGRPLGTIAGRSDQCPPGGRQRPDRPGQQPADHLLFLSLIGFGHQPPAWG